MSARESLHEGADKKNPGEEGYGSLQGRATASYSPNTARSVSTQHFQFQFQHSTFSFNTALCRLKVQSAFFCIHSPITRGLTLASSVDSDVVNHAICCTTY